MGLLYLGTPLVWDEAKKYADHVRSHGITQFLHIWDRLKDRQGDELLWGDEIEYMVVSFDAKEKNAKLSLRQQEILEKINSAVDDISAGAPNNVCVPKFHPEYGRYMLESTPGAPYTGSIPDLLSVENNMRYRRNLARKHLNPNEIPITITSFPRLGVPGNLRNPSMIHATPSPATVYFYQKKSQTRTHVSRPCTANIRRRRGSKVAINLPIYFDEKTPRPFIDPTIPWDRAIYPEDSEAKRGAALPDHIYLDAMGFGMGCCCLQLTFQACNVADARRMYDGLIPIGPLLLALTAASPIWRGYLADVDCRWNVIAGSVDDRTEEERGLKPIERKQFRTEVSLRQRHLYISDDWVNRPEYNDNPITLRREHLQPFAHTRHISHLFIRDPLVVFSETIDQDDTSSSDHFENIQSTNWQTLRFKPPPPNSPIGWRVEFRSMEVQMTDFENAAFAVFVVLLSRAIFAFNLNFYIPISKVDENMARAQQRDASASKKFFFKKDVYATGRSATIERCNQSFGRQNTSAMKCTAEERQKMKNCFPPPPLPENGFAYRGPVEDEYEEMTMKEIMNGKGDNFPGLLALVDAYLETLEIELRDMEKIQQYLDFVRRRSDGRLLTPATWIRNFVTSHPDYRKDSVVSQTINYDLLVAVDEIERGVRRAPDLLPADYRGGDKDTRDPLIFIF
uniref:Glutamate--cysteine ligase n=1 Tax=Hebeloma cylindrosporum TaxID=76867 RepID=A0A451ER05_HEBCY|nr:gammaglutamyl cysteine synthetase 1 [Hebeloma cylindrosporum]